MEAHLTYRRLLCNVDHCYGMPRAVIQIVSCLRLIWWDDCNSRGLMLLLSFRLARVGAGGTLSIALRIIIRLLLNWRGDCAG